MGYPVILAGVPPGAGQYRFVRVIPVLIFPGARGCVGFVLPAKRQVIPLPGTGPEPAVSAWATASTALAPPCCSPGGAPVRKLLMDGYVNEIRDDQDHPSWNIELTIEIIRSMVPSGALPKARFSTECRPMPVDTDMDY